MEYWLVYKPNSGKRKYIAGFNEYGIPTHTYEKSKAYKFYSFDSAMINFNFGYHVTKEYS